MLRIEWQKNPYLGILDFSIEGFFSDKTFLLTQNLI